MLFNLQRHNTARNSSIGKGELFRFHLLDLVISYTGSGDMFGTMRVDQIVQSLG